MPEYFGYEAIARSLGVPAAQLRELEQAVRSQHGADQMLFELRMLRTLKAIEEGTVRISDAIAEFREQGVRS